ncbi:hypothetical protein G7066_02415 [Leucobacter coleopterorum]|uniref:Uncharacterized protein n=1 Tax=Leucobacter coleopterorum TaxID=2714933 RepID=A0ABX6JU66_9MICO|nr:hypothetical protein [Leucobacter coleopterorum]QIM17831.1 hypothetical protein G7066_02415 [Leucobacter coleopterorum]
MTGVLSRRSRLVTVSATAVAFGASLAFGGATAVFAEEPQPIIDVVYVATNVDTSQFDTGTIAVTYSPSYDATHPVPDLSLYGGVGEPQPMTINYTVAPQAPAAGTTSVVTAPVSGWPVVKTSTSAGTTGGIVGATASYLSFSAVAGAGSTSNIPAAQASWTTHWADVLSGKYQPTSTIEVKRQSSPLLPAGFGAMTQPVYAMSTSASNGVSGPAGANIPVFATASGMDGVARATYTTPFPIVSDTDSHTVDILRGAGDGDLSKTQTVNLNMSFGSFVLTTTDGTTPVDPDVKPAITSKAPRMGWSVSRTLTSSRARVRRLPRIGCLQANCLTGSLLMV